MAPDGKTCAGEFNLVSVDAFYAHAFCEVIIHTFIGNLASIARAKISCSL